MTALAFLGLAAAIGLIVYYGAGTVLAALAVAGIGIVWTSLTHIAPMLLNARGWQILFPRESRPRFALMLWMLWLREAVDAFLPLARIGGEVAAARLLAQRGFEMASVVASLVVDITVALVCEIAFVLIGLGLFAVRAEGDGVAESVLPFLASGILVVAVFAVAQRAGLFALVDRVLGSLGSHALIDAIGEPTALDSAVKRTYARRRTVLACVTWELAGWIVGSIEVWTSLYFLHAPVGIRDAIIIEALIQALVSSAFLVPGALGVQEAGFVGAGALIGLPPETALAVALIRRARDIIIYVPALAVLQASLGLEAVLHTRD